MNSSFYRRDGSAYMNFENGKDENKSLRENNWKQESTLFVQINDPNRVPSVHRQLQSYIANNNKALEDFQVSELALDLFTTMADRDRAEEILADTWQAPPLAAVIGSAIMGIAINCLQLLFIAFIKIIYLLSIGLGNCIW